jgi:hypothetical protein
VGVTSHEVEKEKGTVVRTKNTRSTVATLASRELLSRLLSTRVVVVERLQ